MEVKALFIGYYVLCLTLTAASGQICQFHLFNADCRFRVDGISMAHITATINYCHDPVDITFNLECDNPLVKWSHTFVNDNEIQSVYGFGVSVQLRVLMRIVEEDKLWVRVYFNTGQLQRVTFVDQKVSMVKVKSCTQLNQAGKIAVGCLITLLIIAGILVVILIIVRRKRMLAEQRDAAIIRHMESNEQNVTVPESLQDNQTPYGHDENTNGSASPVIRFNLPTILEQTESSSDSGHVSIEIANGHEPRTLHMNTGAAGLPT